MRAAIFGLFLSVVIQGLGGLMVSASSDAWLDSTVSVISRNTLAAPYDAPVCSGSIETIYVAANGEFDASCVFGVSGGMRVARFFTGTAYLHAVSFPHEQNFHELREACALTNCVYSPVSDTLVTHQYIGLWQYSGILYKNFSSSLVRHFDPAKFGYYFQFEPSSPPDYELKAGDRMMATGALGISTNGKWALFEAKEYGVVRVNVETLEARRVVAPGAPYGLGGDPVYELAVSNDGKHLAVTGRGLPLTVTSVNDTCGDRLVSSIERYYLWNIVHCPLAVIDFTPLYPTYTYSIAPKFDAEGQRLGVTTKLTNGTLERVIFAPGSKKPPENTQYMALGDSFTSGEGELSDRYYQAETDEFPAKCHISTRSYPYLIGALWDIPTRNIACSGAKTADIVARGELVSLYQPDILSVSVGGNDAGLVSKLTTCLNVGTCEWVNNPAKRYATSQEVAAIYPKLLSTFDEIKTNSPQSKVIVVGYPQIVTTNSVGCDALTGTLLNQDERRFMVETIRYLNQVVKAAASAKKLPFIDIETSFAGHELCGSWDSLAMNSVRLGDDIAPIKILSKFRLFGAESFHPTPYGHQLIASKITNLYPAVSLLPDCLASCFGSAELLEPSSYWRLTPEAHSNYVRQIQDDSLSLGIVEAGKQLAIQTKKLIFAGGSAVRIEIHSDTLVLKETTTAADGTVHVSVEIPSTISSGYHTLHLFGTSVAGEPIDVYRTIAVGTNEELTSVKFEETIAGIEPSHTKDAPTVSLPLSKVFPVKGSAVASESATLNSVAQPTVLGAQSANEEREKDAVSVISVPGETLIVLGGLGVLALLTLCGLWLKWKYSSPDTGG